MLEKLAAIAKTKAALALLGVALVGGTGGAVAVAANTGHLNTLGVNLNKSDGQDNSHGNSSDSHAHTEAVNGLLTGCKASSITVKDKDGKVWTFVVSSSTKFNGDVNSGSQDASSSAADGKGSGTGDSSTHSGDNSAKGSGTGDSSSHGGSSSAKGTETGDNTAKGTETGDSSQHVVTLAQVCAAANINTRHVQVQATKNGSTYDAWKVTLQGPGDAKGDSSSSDSKGAGSDSASSTSGQSGSHS